MDRLNGSLWLRFQPVNATQAAGPLVYCCFTFPCETNCLATGCDRLVSPNINEIARVWDFYVFGGLTQTNESPVNTGDSDERFH